MDCLQYDMLTTPITTSYFHSRVLTQLSFHLTNAQTAVRDESGAMATSKNTRPLVVSPLSIEDTHLTPDESMAQLIGVTSAWIDLCSPDPLIADISRQVLMREVAYAAFCGIGYLLIPGPKLHHGIVHSEGLVYYARAVLDALNFAPYVQVHLWLRMLDNPDFEIDQMGDLAPLARGEYLCHAEGEVPSTVDQLGTWDAWDTIRRICKYHARLFVGENKSIFLVDIQARLFFPGHVIVRKSLAKTKLTFSSTILTKPAASGFCAVAVAL